MRVAVLITTFNRVQTTLRGLDGLHSALTDVPEVVADVFLVDDGSTDGTGAAVARAYPAMHVILGSGSLYWNRGMCLAFAEARKAGPYDAYLLMNDDIQLSGDIRPFFEYFRRNRETLLAGAFTSEDHAHITYSGFNRPTRLRPLRLDTASLTGISTQVDTVNGNFVLVPGELMERLGGLDPVYTHALGDLDLGLRARDLGASVEVFSDPLGVCAKGPTLTERLAARPRRERWAQSFGPIFGIRPYAHFVWRHGTRVLFPFYMAKALLARLVYVLR
ncbi:hypothetical protein Microterr_04440 [Microbacterium terricola]|uniref:Glycosyltransferase 2-like domain-containing protein n=1 Tax=Microbacterium terricola TaxID=344163 RepID=A0ABM8DVW3_9MICO|nr:hypothetical protein Microterr_04440 [Microbacterium terricola]